MRHQGLRRLAFATGIAVSTAFAYLAVRDVDFHLFWTTLQDGRYWILLPALGVLAVGLFVRALRWRVLFVKEHRPPLSIVASSLLVGYLFNSILPARAGEAARVVVLHQRAKTSRFEALATVVVERVLDVLVLLALLFATTPVIPESTWMREGAVVGGVLFVVLTALLVLLALHGLGAARVMLRPLALLPNVTLAQTERAAANLVRGLVVFRRPEIALQAVALTAISWIVIAASFWLCFLALRVDQGFEAALLVVIAVNLAMVLPSAPAGLGVFHAATVLTLSAFGVDRAQALSYAVVVHALNFLPLIVVGYAVLYRHTAAVRRSSGAAAEPAALAGRVTDSRRLGE